MYGRELEWVCFMELVKCLAWNLIWYIQEGGWAIVVIE